MEHRIQHRRGTAAQWTSANPVLASGEPGFETDTHKSKIGDGTSHWADLPYAPTLPDVSAAQGASLQKAANLSDLVSASSARTNLGLGSAATHPVADFDAVGTAANAIVAHIAATDPHGDRAFTTAQIAGLVNSAPGLLDTLGEIAAQLANDESAVGALTTLVNTKLSIATAQATYVQRTQVVVGLDTDGTPYWDAAVEYANARAVALDTDSVPYVVTG